MTCWKAVKCTSGKTAPNPVELLHIKMHAQMSKEFICDIVHSKTTKNNLCCHFWDVFPLCSPAPELGHHLNESPLLYVQSHVEEQIPITAKRNGKRRKRKEPKKNWFKVNYHWHPSISTGGVGTFLCSLPPHPTFPPAAYTSPWTYSESDM
jgi:hypothetical protein